ncbi:MAG: glycosyltransferase family 9 protein [Acidobacteria bacterium]|nr:glycosyltransferase family 9 protein [Acidobacteriota bacterium]
MNKFLIIRLGSLGDVIHGIPAAAALRHRYPEARIDWVVDPRYVGLLDLVDGIDARIPFDPRDLLRGRAAAWATVRELRGASYDAVIDLQGLLKSAVLARLAGGRRTIGFPRPHLREPLARLFYTDTPDAGGAPHVIDKNLALLGALDVSDRRVRFPLAVTRTPAVAAAQAQAGGAGYALLNPGAAWPNKRWPAARFGAVAASLRRDFGLRSLVLWGPDEQPLARAVVAASEGAAALAPQTTIADLVGIAQGARVMISGDTGPLHIGGAVGTPIVALFGPTFAERNGPWSPRDVVVSRTARCGCCYERRCRRASPCIDDIGVDEVRDAVRRRLTAHG